jgi:7-keto-8-aminopelargonate synthetase-like enzyme
MIPLFESDLIERLATLREQSLLRQLRQVDSPQSTRIKIEGKTFLNFSSNDYLGLANHPNLKSSAIKAIEKYGCGAGASRLISGSLKPHHELEDCLAAFKGTEAALGFSSGYAAAVGGICALVGKQDILILDKLVHASIIDAARLCGAQLRIFRHNDLDDLEQILRETSSGSDLREGHLDNKAGINLGKRSRQKQSVRTGNHRDVALVKTAGRFSRPRRLIVTESIFSMDGDCAPLRELVALKEKYGAWLMVDEAHATGLYGVKHRGMAEELGVSEWIEIQMGTLGKALGSAGGYICGTRSLIDLLINRARSFIFSTAPVPAATAAATAAIRLVQSAEGELRRRKLRARLAEFRSGPGPQLAGHHTHIIPLLIGDEDRALRAANNLRRDGIFIPGIRYPTVPRNEARLRVTLSANHVRADVQKLLVALAKHKFGAGTKNGAPLRPTLPEGHWAGKEK